MSSLIFHTDEKGALIATDTLAVSPDGKPLRFTTKAFFVPHLRMVMAGTGVGGFLDRWLLLVNGGVIVPGIEALNSQATEGLSSIWRLFKKDFPLSTMTTTVYHFGWSEIDRQMKVFVYRSENDFVGEPLQYGVGIKPDCTVKDDVCFPNDLPAMMDEQRAIQRAKPELNRIYIGGEIIVHHLTAEGCCIFSKGSFDDAREDAKAIYNRSVRVKR